MDTDQPDHQSYVELVDAAAEHCEAFPQDRFDGRGIIIPAGGARMFTCAWVAIRMLRDHLGCTLPIEVWHLGDREMSPSMKAMLAEQDVSTVDALEVAGQRPVRTLGGWELKPYAIIHSRFKNVIMIDADNVPLRDPAFLFETPEYLEHGSIFWPDVVALTDKSAMWRICGVKHQPQPSFETGQLVIDKQRCWHPLQLTMVMNEHSDFFYQHVYGDKDTFLMAWLRLGQSFAMTSHAVRRLPGTMCQHDFNGNVLFQHRNRRKWSLDGRNFEVEGFVEESRCYGYLDELRKVWNGKVFSPPQAGPAAASTAAAIEEQKWFAYERVSDRKIPMEFLSAHRIGAGRTNTVSYWWTEEVADGTVELIIGNGDLAKLHLRCDPFGVWRGKWPAYEEYRIDLIPLDQAPEAGSIPGGHNSDTGQLQWDAGIGNYDPIY